MTGDFEFRENEEHPDEEMLVELLKTPGVAPRITLDLTNSDGPQTGIVWAELDKQGNLVLTRVS